jgi:type I restriction enzyme, R subunit
VLDDRTKLVAKKVTEFLKESGDRLPEDHRLLRRQEHAARMRQALINENADLVPKNHRYVMRITGDDKEGQASSATSSTRKPLSGDRHHLAAALHRRRCADLPLIVLDRESAR